MCMLCELRKGEHSQHPLRHQSRWWWLSTCKIVDDGDFEYNPYCYKQVRLDSSLRAPPGLVKLRQKIQLHTTKLKPTDYVGFSKLPYQVNYLNYHYPLKATKHQLLTSGHRCTDEQWNVVSASTWCWPESLVLARPLSSTPCFLQMSVRKRWYQITYSPAHPLITPRPYIHLR